MSRRRRRSTARGNQRPNVLDWSTSYMASASSSHGHSASTLAAEESSAFEEDSADDDSIHSRPATVVQTPVAFTRRSLSPVVQRRNIDNKDTNDANNVHQENGSHVRTPSSLWSSYHHQQTRRPINLLPKYYLFNTSIPIFSAHIDIRQLLEHLILFAAASLALAKFTFSRNVVHEPWITRELGALTVVSALYLIATRKPAKPTIVQPHIEHPHRRHASPVVVKDSPPKPSLLWMTTPKDYRIDADDGVLTALLLGPMAAASMLYGTLITNNIPGHAFYPPGWMIESPAYLTKSLDQVNPKVALLNSRRSLLQSATLCSFVLLAHICTSNLASSNGAHWTEEGQKKMRKGWRSWSFIGYAISITTATLLFRLLCDHLSWEIWKDLSYFDVAVISSFYQFSVYVMIRLSHGGFTLGEVGLVALGSTVLFMEAVNMTIAQIWPVTTPFIKTTRLPSPLVIYQLALVPGSLVIGFLLSPLLVLSRHTSQLPAHRLKHTDRRMKNPKEREIQRRFLAIGFYFFAALIVFGLIGFWTKKCLGGRNPWVWAVLWLTEGKRPWSRSAMLIYWALLGSFSVAAWGRQLARSRKFQRSNMAMNGGGMPVDPAFAGDVPPPSPASTNGFSHVATDLLDAADKRVPTLSLNARRKSFHALALFMFLPGIILDPAFTYFCFSAAFALFVFAEYIRYFALYPFGRFVHIFLNEFVDAKDSGSAILSHFYLLTGFANSLWFEGPWRLLEFTGALSLGIGDAMASIVGRRFGRIRWTEGNPKTVEGSLAFFVSVFTSYLVLRVFGAVEPFSISRYSIVLATGCLLEAVSNQNDNLTIPIFIWSMTIFSGSVQA